MLGDDWVVATAEWSIPPKPIVVVPATEVGSDVVFCHKNTPGTAAALVAVVACGIPNKFDAVVVVVVLKGENNDDEVVTVNELCDVVAVGNELKLVVAG